MFKNVDIKKEIEMITPIFEMIKPELKNREIIFFMGGTGAGKSTLLNYLFGTRYQLEENSLSGQTYAQLRQNQTEYFAVGHGMTSQTLYPKIKDVEQSKISFCDLAGYPDNRGTQETLCAASVISLLNKSLLNLKGIVFVTDWKSLSVDRGKAFSEKLLILAKIMKSNVNAIKDSVALIITQSDGRNISSAQIKYNIELCINRESEKTNPTTEEQQVLGVLQQLVSSENIICANVFDEGASCTQLKTLLTGLKSQPSSCFDFSEAIQDQGKFKKSLQKISQKYLDMKADIEKKEKQMQENFVSLQKFQDENKKLGQESESLASVREKELEQFEKEQKDIQQKKKSKGEIEGAIIQYDNTIKHINNLQTYNHQVGSGSLQHPAAQPKHTQVAAHKDNINTVINNCPNLVSHQVDWNKKSRPRRHFRWVHLYTAADGIGADTINNPNNFPVQLMVDSNAKYVVTQGSAILPNSSVNVSYPLGYASSLNYRLLAEEKHKPENQKLLLETQNKKAQAETSKNQLNTEIIQLETKIQQQQEKLNKDPSLKTIGENNEKIKLNAQKQKDCEQKNQQLSLEIKTLEEDLQENKALLTDVKRIAELLQIEDPAIKTSMQDFAKSNSSQSVAANPYGFHSLSAQNNLNTRSTAIEGYKTPNPSFQ